MFPPDRALSPHGPVGTARASAPSAGMRYTADLEVTFEADSDEVAGAALISLVRLLNGLELAESQGVESYLSRLRWERIAVRIFGDPNRRDEAKTLYDRARGSGASKRSYTGRGRRFPEMDP